MKQRRRWQSLCLVLCRPQTSPLSEVCLSGVYHYLSAKLNEGFRGLTVPLCRLLQNGADIFTLALCGGQYLLRCAGFAPAELSSP